MTTHLIQAPESGDRLSRGRVILPVPGQASTPEWPTAFVLLGLVGLIVWSRLGSYALPVNVDISLMQVIGHELLEGRLLYTELWDNKPPLPYVLFAASELIAGWGPEQVLLVGVFLSATTMLGTYAAGSVVGPLGGLLAATAWTVVQADLGTEAQHPNGEAFVNACVIWGFALVVRGRTRWGPAILWALATLFKSNAIAFPMVFAVAHLGLSRDRRGAAWDVAAWVGVGTLGWALTGLWFAWQGRMDHLVEAVFTYNRFYTGSIGRSLLTALIPYHALPPLLMGAVPFLLLGLLGFAMRPRGGALWRWLAVFLFGAWIAMLLPGKFFWHYYQLYLPVLAVGAGWGAASLIRRNRGAGLAATTLGFLLAITWQIPAHGLSRDEWVRRAHRVAAERYLPLSRTTETVKSLLGPGETLFEVGSQSAYYIETQTRPPTGVFFLKHMAEGPAAERLTRMAMAELRERPPALVVYDSVYAALHPDHPIHGWLEENYDGSEEHSAGPRATIHLRRSR